MAHGKLNYCSSQEHALMVLGETIEDFTTSQHYDDIRVRLQVTQVAQGRPSFQYSCSRDTFALASDPVHQPILI